MAFEQRDPLGGGLDRRNAARVLLGAEAGEHVIEGLIEITQAVGVGWPDHSPAAAFAASAFRAAALHFGHQLAR